VPLPHRAKITELTWQIMPYRDGGWREMPPGWCEIYGHIVNTIIAACGCYPYPDDGEPDNGPLTLNGDGVIDASHWTTRLGLVRE
jgi:hypothetical protein